MVHSDRAPLAVAVEASAPVEPADDRAAIARRFGFMAATGFVARGVSPG